MHISHPTATVSLSAWGLLPCPWHLLCQPAADPQCWRLTRPGSSCQPGTGDDPHSCPPTAAGWDNSQVPAPHWLPEHPAGLSSSPHSSHSCDNTSSLVSLPRAPTTASWDHFPQKLLVLNILISRSALGGTQTKTGPRCSELRGSRAWGLRLSALEPRVSGLSSGPAGSL